PGLNSVIDSSRPPTFRARALQTDFSPAAGEARGGAAPPATFVFEAVDAQYVSLDNKNNTGIITGVAAPPVGTKPAFRVTATPSGGGAPYSFVSHIITIEPPTSAPSSSYGINDDFGRPSPASASNPNDFLIQRNQSTIAYTQSRGTRNWVSYELDTRQIASGQDRCNCFTADPLLPANKQIFTSDYTSGGYDRGHMDPSADRTVQNVDN